MDTVLRIREEGASAVAGQFGRLEDRVSRIGGAATRTTGRLKAMLSTDMGSLTGGLGRIYALIGGIGAAAAGKKIVDFSRGLTLLKAEAGMSNAELAQLKARIMSLSDATSTLPTDILEAYNVFQSFGGQMGLARDIMGDLAKMSKATGTPLGELANIAAALGTNLKMDRDQIVDLLGLVRELGREGQMSFKDISGKLPLLIAGATTAGWRGARGVQQMTAAHQVAAKSFGTGPDASARAQVAIDAMIRDLVAKADKIKASTGINVMEGPKGQKRLRDLPSLMMEIGAATKGDPRMLSKIFGEEARRGASAFLTVGGGISPDVARMFGVKGDRRNLDAAYKAATTGSEGALVEKADRAAAMAERGLQGPGGDVLKFLSENSLAAGGLALGGYGAMKFLAPMLGRRLLGGKGAPGAGGAAGSIVGGVGMPVRVVNWPASLGGPSAGMPSGSRELALGGAAKAGLAGAAGAALAAGVIGMGIGEADTRQKAELSRKAIADASRVLGAAQRAGGYADTSQARAGLAKEQGALLALGPAAPLASAIERLDATLRAEPREVKVSFLGGELDKPTVKASRGSVR